MRRRLAPDDLAKQLDQPERSRPKPFDDGWVQESFSLPRGRARRKLRLRSRNTRKRPTLPQSRAISICPATGSSSR